MFKKYGIVIILSVLVVGLLVVLVNRDRMYEYISENMQNQMDDKKTESVAEMVNEKYNYLKNKEDFEFTFLEFSSGACANCKRMEPVMEEIKKSEKVKANVVYIHTIQPENQELMKYYGISATPMQILLDKSGKEFFRNYGFISTADLEAKFLEQKNKI